MNGTVKRIVEILFQDTEMTEEVQAIRDELMDNCQQRYEDLIGQGRSEDEAIAMVIESLKGMEEVIGAYPRSRSAEAREEQDGEHDRTMLFPAAQVKHVEVNLLYQDVSFVPGLGEHVIVHVEGKEEARVDVRLTGDTLRIMRAEESLGKGGRWWDRLFCISWSECVRVEVPATCWCGLTAHCTSGDLSVQNVIFQQVHMEAMSGDISVRNDTMGFSQELILKSTSGDIRVEYNAKRMELQSMSGDVTVDGMICPELSAQSISGDVRLCGHFEQVRIKSVSGDVRMESLGQNLRQVDAKTTSGDVDIRLPQETPGVHLTGKSSIGDVRNAFPDLGPETGVQVNAQTASGDVRIRRA